jgi:hypothetical protein
VRLDSRSSGSPVITAALLRREFTLCPLRTARARGPCGGGSVLDLRLRQSHRQLAENSRFVEGRQLPTVPNRLDEVIAKLQATPTVLSHLKTSRRDPPSLPSNEALNAIWPDN